MSRNRPKCNLKGKQEIEFTMLTTVFLIFFFFNLQFICRENNETRIQTGACIIKSNQPTLIAQRCAGYCGHIKKDKTHSLSLRREGRTGQGAG